MLTNHTPNFGLCQWEQSDKVLMDDFNADNAKVDEALGDIDRRAGMKLIREAVLEEPNVPLGFTLEGIPWEEYGLIVVAFDPILRLNSPVSVGFSGYSVGEINRTVNAAPQCTSGRIIGAPMFHKESSLTFITMGFVTDKIFSLPAKFGEQGGATLSGYMDVGSAIRLWGLR